MGLFDPAGREVRLEVRCNEQEEGVVQMLEGLEKQVQKGQKSHGGGLPLRILHHTLPHPDDRGEYPGQMAEGRTIMNVQDDKLVQELNAAIGWLALNPKNAGVAREYLTAPTIDDTLLSEVEAQTNFRTIGSNDVTHAFNAFVRLEVQLGMKILDRLLKFPWAVGAGQSGCCFGPTAWRLCWVRSGMIRCAAFCGCS